MQLFRPLQLVVLAAEGKTGIGLIEEVTLMGELSRPMQLVVLAAEGKIGLVLVNL